MGARINVVEPEGKGNAETSSGKSRIRSDDRSLCANEVEGGEHDERRTTSRGVLQGSSNKVRKRRNNSSHIKDVLRSTCHVIYRQSTKEEGNPTKSLYSYDSEGCVRWKVGQLSRGRQILVHYFLTSKYQRVDG